MKSFYLCSQCNVVLNEPFGKKNRPQCSQGHKARIVYNSLWVHVVLGIVISIAFIFLAGLVWSIAGMFTSVRILFALPVFLLLIAVGVKEIRDGLKYSKMPQPAPRLAKNILAGGLTVIAAFVLLVIAGIVIQISGTWK